MDPFAVDVLHLVGRYSQLATEALDVKGEGWASPSEDAWAVESMEDEDAWRKKCAEEEQSLQRALERLKELCLAEQRRLSSAGGELLAVYAAARRQELETAKRCFQDSEVKTHISQKVLERANTHLGPLSRKTPQTTPREPRARSAWAGEVGRAVINTLRQEWRTGQKQVLQQLAKDMRGALTVTGEVLQKHLEQQQSSAEASKALWSKRLEQQRERLKRLVEAYRLTLSGMYQAELKEVQRHGARQSQFYAEEAERLKNTEKKESQRRVAKIKRLKSALGKWQTQYLAHATEKGGEAAAMRAMIKVRASQDAEAEAKAEAAAERLQACGVVLEHLWDTSDLQDEAWNFLHGLEEEVPCTVESLQLYEDFLAKHGVLGALTGPFITSACLEEAESAMRDAETPEPLPAKAKSPAKGGWK